MNYRQVPILTLIAIAIGLPCAHADGSVVVAAQEAQAAVVPRVAGQKLVNLPALDFHLRAAVQCAGIAQSLTLSVADSVTTLSNTQFADQRSAEVSLSVPARQIALAASSHFCLGDDPTSADELTVAGLVTAHASLRCADDEGTSVHFANTPLQVRLVCVRETGEDQESSPDK